MPVRVVTMNPGDISLRIECSPDQRSYWDLVEGGRWEPETLHAMHQIVSPEDRVIDIGAWIGVTAFYAAGLGADVVAYEPDPRAVAELRASLDRNDSLQVSVRPVALSTKPGVAQLRSRSLGDSMASLVRARGAASDSIEVECRAVDSEARNEHFAGARLVKIDVEGYEFELFPPLMTALRSGAFAGDVLLSTHAYPTIEMVVRRFAGHLRAESPSHRRRRLFAVRFVVPLVMLGGNIRLLWAIRNASSAWITPNSGRKWEDFSLKHRFLFVIRPRDRELWLQWKA